MIFIILNETFFIHRFLFSERLNLGIFFYLKTIYSVKLKLLFHIIPTLRGGGAETVLSRIVEELSKSGIVQCVFTLKGSINDMHYPKVSKYAKVINHKKDFKLINEIILENPEAPILSWMYPGILFSHRLKYRLKTKNPIVWNIRHSNFRWYQIYQKLALFGFGFYSRLINPKIIYCAHSSKLVHEKYFFSKKNSIVIQNRLAKKMMPFKKNLKDSKQPFLLYVGRYDPVKGPDRLIKIAQEFLKNKESYSLTIAGSGWKDAMIPQDLKSKVLLAGNVSNISELYQEAVVLLFTSYTEGYPNVLVEALASGTPIIGYEAGDSRLILDSYDLGYSVSNQKQFIDRLNLLTKELPSQNQKLKAAQRQIKQLDFSITVSEYKKFLTL
jgi:glycosyltransferase involved in cell wall biosynthesis